MILSMNRRGRLLGSFGVKLIADSWEVSSEMLTKAVQDCRLDLRCDGGLVKNGLFKGQVKDLNWDKLAALLATQNEDLKPGWAKEIPGDQVFATDPLWLEDLPLLQCSITVLERMRVTLNIDLISLLNRPREDFFDSPSGALTLLDLEYQLQEFRVSPKWISSITPADQNQILEEVAGRLLDNYRRMDGERLSSDWTQYFLRRFSWGFPKATLDEIGVEAGVTRERVRQVQSRLADYVGWRRWPMPDVLIEVLELLKKSNFSDVENALASAPFVRDNDWTAEELIRLFDWFGYPYVSSRLKAEFNQVDIAQIEKQKENQAIESEIRRFRSPLGLLNSQSVHLPDGSQVESDLVKIVTRGMYGRYFDSGDWILCGVKDSLTTVERTAAQQLSVVSPLPTSEVYEGMERHRTYKGAPALPPRDRLLELLELSGLLIRSGSSVEAKVIVPIDGIAAWLRSQLLDADGHVLHKDTIYRAAIHDGVNISSLTVHFLYSSLLRSVGEPKGLVRLLGSSPSLEDVIQARTIADAFHEPSSIALEVRKDQVILKLELGSYAVASGLYPAKPDVVQFWPKGGARVNCFCDRSSEARVKITKSHQLLGWHPLIAHIMLNHGGQIGSVVTAQLRDGRVDVLRVD